MLMSVIVPSLNGEVPQSLFKQIAGDDEVELVVVSGERLVGKARNEGIRRATGEWIAWVDADDEVRDDWLAEIKRAINEGEVAEHGERNDAILFDAINDGWPTCSGDLVYGKPNVPVREVVNDVYEDSLLYSHLWRTVTRHELWNGILFDEKFREMTDHLVLPLVLVKAKRITYIPRMLYFYHYGNRQVPFDVERVTDAIAVALRRWNRAPQEYRKAATKGALPMIYQQLLAMNIHSGTCTEAEGRANLKAGRRFLCLHCMGLDGCWRHWLRFLFAGLNFWLPIHLAHWWYHRNGTS